MINEQALKEHGQIIEALKVRNETQAEKLVQRHIVQFQQGIKAALQGLGQSLATPWLAFRD